VNGGAKPRELLRKKELIEGEEKNSLARQIT